MKKHHYHVSEALKAKQFYFWSAFSKTIVHLVFVVVSLYSLRMTFHNDGSWIVKAAAWLTLIYLTLVYIDKLSKEYFDINPKFNNTKSSD